MHVEWRVADKQNLRNEGSSQKRIKFGSTGTCPCSST